MDDVTPDRQFSKNHTIDDFFTLSPDVLGDLFRGVRGLVGEQALHSRSAKIDTSHGKSAQINMSADVDALCVHAKRRKELILDISLHLNIPFDEAERLHEKLTICAGEYSQLLAVVPDLDVYFQNEEADIAMGCAYDHVWRQQVGTLLEERGKQLPEGFSFDTLLHLARADYLADQA